MSKSIYAAFEMDAEKEQDGIWLDYGEIGSILVARAGGSNKKFAKMLDQRARPYKRQMKKETMQEDVANRLMIEVFADTIILGWKGIRDRAGDEMEYTRENVIKLFMDLPELFADVSEQSMAMGNFQHEEVEEASKN